jgi:hypothetical protein
MPHILGPVVCESTIGQFAGLSKPIGQGGGGVFCASGAASWAWVLNAIQKPAAAITEIMIANFFITLTSFFS